MSRRGNRHTNVIHFSDNCVGGAVLVLPSLAVGIIHNVYGIRTRITSRNQVTAFVARFRPLLFMICGC
ncbi:hypothetical protein CY34DRAFT_736357 [Suillus luteus UH-Slu-Lm8-n1]|uniref:Uncharacterized protein n=1 Tax=Suillus luteus UH-Slu-Lm8-n1 TaxID=930992 RepID=A0A0D0B9T7_9AGAM|nr:hypothetical protein CY34DRAFT_736357 [Suillus luteus UH-Slu-Lm8-n1]